MRLYGNFSVKYKNGYFLLVHIQQNKRKTLNEKKKNGFVYACIEFKYGDISVERLISNFDVF